MKKKKEKGPHAALLRSLLPPKGVLFVLGRPGDKKGLRVKAFFIEPPCCAKAAIP
ncbi:MAG TPA: hypothetical protein VNT00_04325 [Eoetvoesiella sp.]|nr:hypothetical protein [Eoetvoesiella sp.]